MKEAVAAQQAGDLDKAIHSYRILLDKYPNIAAIRSNLGAALAAQGRYQQAIVEYKQALKLSENSQVRLNLGLAYYKAGDLTNAINTLKKARDESPSNLQIVTVLADSYLQRGEYKDVVDLLTPIQRADPANQALTYMLGTALVRDGQSAKGQLVIDGLLRNGDSAEVHYLMGTTKVMAADFSGARDDFQKAAELNPNLPDVYAQYGETLLSTGDQEGARKAFARELQLNPNNFEANLRLGVIFRNDENYDAALTHLHHALQIRPGDPGVRYQIASIEVSRDQLDDARRDLESLVKDSPDFIEAHVSLATVYFRQKRKADGERERAIYAKLNAARSKVNEVAVKASPQ
ncbi:MAG: tetratricopeptide repeat protein [Acidobacteriota bacterium]|nr:tetratricopeptide repeat protein [Acidobacteriota bacterium]